MNQANDEQQQLSKKTELMSNTRTSYVNLKKEKKIKIVQLNITKEEKLFILFLRVEYFHCSQRIRSIMLTRVLWKNIKNRFTDT